MNEQCKSSVEYRFFSLGKHNSIPFITILEPVMPLTEALLPEPFKRYILQSALNMDMASLDFTTIPIITCLAALLGNNVSLLESIFRDIT